MAENKYKEIEAKWQKYWEEHPDLYSTENSKVESQKSKKKYILVEFPYPSGSGLHIGHAFTFTGGDVYARYLRMKGDKVLFPMGWDAFGLPTENYAIKSKRKPQEVTAENTQMFKSQMKKLAFSFDWSREVNTTDADYYKWTQWIFIKLFEKGLAVKEEMPINWCPECKIGLANEEVVEGKCERCGAQVSRRNISQWIVKITKYAERLLSGLEETDFIQKVKAAQINWIGKSEGARVKFQIQNDPAVAGLRSSSLEVFTTRPDTLYGATFMVVAPEHILVEKIISDLDISKEEKEKIKEYVKEAKKKSEMERTELSKDKTGVFSGLYAINPVNGKEIPIWISDFVLASYGTGAIMSVPGHDQRDFDFAKKYGLPILPVIIPQRVYVDENAKGYYAKRHQKNWEMIVDLHKLAKENRKTLMLSGGWAAAIQCGIEYRDNEDIDMAILESEKGWWVEELTKIGLKVGAAYEQENAEIWFQAMRDLPEGADTHIDIAVVKSTDGFEMIDYKEMNFLVRKKELIVSEKMSEIDTGKEKRWKEEADFLMLNYKAYTDVDNGIMINSGEWNGLETKEAIREAIKYVEEKKIGKRAVSYHLRDWIFSRQHYWGEPIPMINCEKCGWMPVPEEQLPVVLPEVEAYEPTDDGKSPLSKIEDWVKTTCPKCGGEAKRETDTMPNWAGSDWYFLRYIDPFNKEVLASMSELKKWLPVDVYIGGDEHNTLHLLYSRFIYQFLYDLGVVPENIREPYYKRLSHGVILGPDNQRMSKSSGNVVVPEVVSDKYGVDALRLYLMFMGPFDGTMAWNENTLMGVKRFVDRFNEFDNKLTREIKMSKLFVSNEDEYNEVKYIINKTIKKVSEDIEQFKFNTAIASLMELINSLHEIRIKYSIKPIIDGKLNWMLVVSKDSAKKIIKLLAPFAPYTAEEMWSLIKEKSDVESVHMAQWPEVQVKYLIEEKVKVAVAINGKVRVVMEIDKDEVTKQELVIKKAMEDERISKWLLNKKIVKEIYVPGKMLNLVVLE